MVRKIFQYLAIAALGALATTAQATSTGWGHVSTIAVQHAGVAFFTLDAYMPSASAWPSCATAQRYAINLATPGGQALYSALLTAQKARSLVAFFGTGVCDVWADSESTDYILVNP